MTQKTYSEEIVEKSSKERRSWPLDQNLKTLKLYNLIEDKDEILDNKEALKTSVKDHKFKMI